MQKATADKSISKNYSTLSLIAGNDTDEIITQKATDLRVEGGVLIRKNAVFRNDIHKLSCSIGTFVGNVFADRIQGSDLIKGVTVKGNTFLENPNDVYCANVCSQIVIANVLATNVISSINGTDPVYLDSDLELIGSGSDLNLGFINTNYISANIANIGLANIDCLFAEKINNKENIVTKFADINGEVHILHDANISNLDSIILNTNEADISLSENTIDTLNLKGDLNVSGQIQTLSTINANLCSDNTIVDFLCVNNVLHTSSIYPKNDTQFTFSGDVLPTKDNEFNLGKTGTQWEAIYTDVLHITGKMFANSLPAVVIQNIAMANIFKANILTQTDMINERNINSNITINSDIILNANLQLEKDLIIEGTFINPAKSSFQEIQSDDYKSLDPDGNITIVGNLSINEYLNVNELNASQICINGELVVDNLSDSTNSSNLCVSNMRTDYLTSNTLVEIKDDGSGTCINDELQILNNISACDTVSNKIYINSSALISGTLYASNIAGTSPVTFDDMIITQQRTDCEGDLQMNWNDILNAKRIQVNTFDVSQNAGNIDFCNSNIANVDCVYTSNICVGTGSVIPIAKNVDFQGNLIVRDQLSVGTATGSITTGFMCAYIGSVAPTNWLLCDGSAVSRITYADLFAAIGVTFGVGDGVSTFNLPDMRTRIPVGQYTGNANFNIIGGTGGTETVTLTTDNLPSHNHSGTTSLDGGHTHTGSSDYTSLNDSAIVTTGQGSDVNRLYATPTNADWILYLVSANEPYHIHSASASTEPAHMHTISSTGSGSTFSIVQKYSVLNYIIRT